MAKYDGKETFDISCLTRIVCCDCGLVHDVSFYEKDDTIFVTFERNEARTEKTRIERLGGKGKLMCKLLDDAIARENLHPENTNENPAAVKSEVVSVGEILKNGEIWLTKKLQK